MGLFDKAPNDASIPLRELLKRGDEKYVGIGGSHENSERWNKLLADYIEAMADDIQNKESLMMMLEVLGQCMIYHKSHLEYLANKDKKPDGTAVH